MQEHSEIWKAGDRDARLLMSNNRDRNEPRLNLSDYLVDALRDLAAANAPSPEEYRDGFDYGISRFGGPYPRRSTSAG